jgi:hypothetical protein
MEGDRRSFRVALTSDRYVNPPPGEVDGLAVLGEAGWGVMQLPAEDYPAELRRTMLIEVAEQAEEFWRRGYDVVLVGEDEDLLSALDSLSMARPDQLVPTSEAALLDFIRARPAPGAAGLL